MVLADNRTKEFSVVTHDVGGKIKRALSDELSLLFEFSRCFVRFRILLVRFDICSPSVALRSLAAGFKAICTH